MEEKDIKRVLKDGAAELGIELGEEALTRFVAYLGELKEWGGRINLTSITTDPEIISRHFLDSLTPYGLLRGCKRLLDIGAGAGFPGIPLKIADPVLGVVLVDSVEKKVRFMRHVIRTLGLSAGAEAVAARADDPRTVEALGAGFDCVISRAFSSLGEFMRIGLPYLAPGGRLIAMKGPAVDEELAGLNGLARAGLSGPETSEVRVPGSDRVTTLVVFKKA